MCPVSLPHPSYSKAGRETKSALPTETRSAPRTQERHFNKTVSCKWEPSTEHNVGILSFEAKTPLGLFKWEEELPRPDESFEACEVKAWLDGKPTWLDGKPIDVYTLEEFLCVSSDLPREPSEKAKAQNLATLPTVIEESLSDWLTVWGEDLKLA